MKPEGNLLVTETTEHSTMTADHVLHNFSPTTNNIPQQPLQQSSGKLINDTSSDMDTGTPPPENDHDDVGNQQESPEQMAGKLNQLQDMVTEMKSQFGSALEALAQIQFGDQMLQERLTNNKLQQDNQLADVVHMVLALKNEFNSVSSELRCATDNQMKLERQIEGLQYERDILLEELHRHGAVSDQLREKYHSGRERPNNLNRSSDQTSLSVMLERAHNVFNMSQIHNNSDHDSGVNTYRDHPDLASLGDVSIPGVDPLVHSYITGLQESLHQSLHDSLHQHSHHDELADNYDSDSSITAAANKSLDMSRSLGDKCAELANLDSGEEETENPVSEARKNDVEIVDMKECSSDNHNSVQQPERNCTVEKLRLVENSPVFAQPHTPKRIAPHERNTKEVQRMRVAREIMETERKYCNNLWTVIDLYITPLQTTGILQPREVSVMFPPSMMTIYDHHCGFLQKLEERITNWKWHSVLGDILCRFIESAECDLLLQYQIFVNDFPASLCQIKKSCKNSARFRKFLRMMQRHPSCDGLDIGCYMVTPIQRIPRYVLLLKQLLKYTDHEHPDYYYVETALEHLGDFLNKLNDSIAYSMQIVGTGTTEETPKMRRKLRIGSFRSSSINSYDANSSKLNDTSIQGGDDHSMLSTSTSASHSRFFNFSFLRDSFKRKQTSTTAVNHSYSVPTHNQFPSADPGQDQQPTANENGRYSTIPDESFSKPRIQHSNSQRDTSFNQSNSKEQSYLAENSLQEQSFSNCSMSNRGDKRRRIKRRSKHGQENVTYESHKEPVEHTLPQIRSTGNGHQGHNGVIPQQKRKYKPRPRSMMDSMSEASLRSSTVTSQSHWPNTTSQESLSTITGDNQTLSSANSTRQRNKNLPILPNMHKSMSYPSNVRTKSLPDVSLKSRRVMPRSNSRKLPIPPTTHQPVRNDYGIYGNQDDVSDEDCFKPPLPHKHHSNSHQLGVPRSASHSDMVDGSHSPSQDYINIALARSLTENHLSDSPGEQPLPRTSTSLIEPMRPSSSSLQQPLMRNQRPRSAKPRHVTLPREGAKPEILNSTRADNSINSSTLDSPGTPVKHYMNDGTIEESPHKKEMPFRRKKDRSSKKAQNVQANTGEGEKEKKKGSLKQSIRSLFFRKRKHDRSVMSSSTSPPCKQNVNTKVYHNVDDNDSNYRNDVNDRCNDANDRSEGSRVIDLIPYDEYPENGHQIYTSTASPSPSTSTLQLQTTDIVNNSVREQRPPHEESIVLEPVAPQLETYADEDGQPCSAV